MSNAYKCSSLGSRLGNFVRPDGETRIPCQSQRRGMREAEKLEWLPTRHLLSLLLQNVREMQNPDKYKTRSTTTSWHMLLALTQAQTFSTFSEALPLLPGRACPYSVRISSIYLQVVALQRIGPMDVLDADPAIAAPAPRNNLARCCRMWVWREHLHIAARIRSHKNRSRLPETYAVMQLHSETNTSCIRKLIFGNKRTCIRKHIFDK